MELDSHKLLAGSGVAADTKTFNEYVQKNLKLYELNNDVQLGTHAAANFIRGEVTHTTFLNSLWVIYLISLSKVGKSLEKRTVPNKPSAGWF